MEGYKYWGYPINDLLPLARDGDEDAYKQLFYDLDGLIVQRSMRYWKKMPTYEKDDFIQEGHILLWKIIERKATGYSLFRAYFAAALNNHFADLYYNYCQHNLIVVWQKENGLLNTAIMTVSDYVWQRKEREKAQGRIYYSAHAEAIALAHSEYRKAHLEDIRERNRAYMEIYHQIHRFEINEKKRLYWHENKDDLNARRREYRKAHKEKVYAQNREYRQNHLEELRQKRRERYRKNPEAEKERCRNYYQAHKKEIMEYQRQYEQANREKIRKYRREYAAKRRAAEKRLKASESQRGENREQIAVCM